MLTPEKSLIPPRISFLNHSYSGPRITVSLAELCDLIPREESSSEGQISGHRSTGASVA